MKVKRDGAIAPNLTIDGFGLNTVCISLFSSVCDKVEGCAAQVELICQDQQHISYTL